MQLIVYFSGLCFLLHERQNLLQLSLVACLKSRRIVEDESRVAPECERPMDIVYPSLMWVGSGTLVDAEKVEYRRGRLKLVTMLEAELILSPMNTRQVLTTLVIYTRVLGCVADSLQERRFSRISPTDYKDTKARIFHSKIIGV